MKEHPPTPEQDKWMLICDYEGCGFQTQPSESAFAIIRALDKHKEEHPDHIPLLIKVEK